MFKISTLNQISSKGLEKFSPESYEVAEALENPDALLVRSQKILPKDLVASLKAIARAGAGVDKICVADCTQKGIIVFNTPGANANSVRELTLLGLLLSTRGVLKGAKFLEELDNRCNDNSDFAQLVEKEKKRFAGSEIKGKILGIVGLGAIGSKVAEIAIAMGMEVLGFDPALSVESAWRLPNQVKRMENLASLLGKSDFITLHLPLLEATKNLINEETIKFCKKGSRLLNFSREGIVKSSAVLEALNAGILARFVSDFPTQDLMGHADVIFMPHIGASTAEAEENCAVMAADQLKDFLVNGNIVNSVNYPTIYLERTGNFRVTFANKNIPNMLGQVLPILVANNLNVHDMINKSKDQAAYSIIDVDGPLTDEVTTKIMAIEGIYAVRCLQ